MNVHFQIGSIVLSSGICVCGARLSDQVELFADKRDRLIAPQCIEIARRPAHIAQVTIRSLLAVLIALTMLLAPFAMQSGGAMAAMPSTQHAQSMDEGHCPSQLDEGQPTNDHSCCAAMCSPFALPPVAAAEMAAPKRAAERAHSDRPGPSHIARLPTPPPRSA